MAMLFRPWQRDPVLLPPSVAGATVNRRVVGSSPTRGASRKAPHTRGFFVARHRVLHPARSPGVPTVSPGGSARPLFVYSVWCYTASVSNRRDILARVMSETGTTQSELSRLSGVRQPSISQMLSGRVEPSDEMLGRLLSCMGFGLEVVRRPVRLELPRSVRRSWLLHRRISTLLNLQSLEEWTPRILGNIEQQRGQLRGEPHRTNLERWGTLVGDGDLPGLHRVLTGLDTDAITMREVSPMRGLLTQRERDEVLRHDADRPT